MEARAVSPGSGRLWAQAVESVGQTLFVAGPGGSEALRQLFARHGLQPAGLCVVADPEQAPEAARQALRPLDARQLVRHVCIVGVWGEVAPYVYPNPCYDTFNDPDEFCYSDAPYGYSGAFDETDPACIFEAHPVGRVPSSDVEVLERVLLTRPTPQEARKALAFAVTAEVWTGPTQHLVEAFLGKADPSRLTPKPVPWSTLSYPRILPAPHWEESHLSSLFAKGGLRPDAILLFNVHGADWSTCWFGHGPASQPEVFSPHAVEDFKGAVIVAEACYGGKLDYEEPGIAEALFARGGRAFVGCSMVAFGAYGRYGTPDAQPTEADLVALGFLQAVQGGRQFGQAMKDARQRAIEGTTNSAPEYAEKTVLTFNFYGAPWDGLGGSAQAAAPGASLLDRTRASMARASHHRGLPKLEEVRERYMRRLGDRGRRFLLEREAARRQFEAFVDAARITQELGQFGLGIEDCRMESVQRDSATSFRISGKTLQGERGAMSVIVVVDGNGRHVATKTTKGLAPPAVPQASNPGEANPSQSLEQGGSHELPETGLPGPSV